MPVDETPEEPVETGVGRTKKEARSKKIEKNAIIQMN